jgi:hypothetical protein
MHSTVGKPILALMTAACVAAPAVGVAQAPATVVAESSAAVNLTASFDPLPQVAQLIDTGGARVASVQDGLTTLAADDIDPELLLELVTAPYHNLVSFAIATGTLSNVGLQVIGLPLSVVGYVFRNQTDQIPAYVDGVQKAAGTAVSDFFEYLQDNIVDYDANLLDRVFGTSFGTTQASGVTTNAVTVAAVPPVSSDPATRVLQLVTLPFHNAEALAVAGGTLANVGLQVISLPLSVVGYVFRNQTDQIPAYITSVEKAVGTAFPNFFDAVSDEVTYSRNVISGVFGGATLTTDAPTSGILANALSVDSASDTVVSAKPAAKDQDVDDSSAVAGGTTTTKKTVHNPVADLTKTVKTDLDNTAKTVKGLLHPKVQKPATRTDDDKASDDKASTDKGADDKGADKAPAKKHAKQSGGKHRRAG